MCCAQAQSFQRKMDCAHVIRSTRSGKAMEGTGCRDGSVEAGDVLSQSKLYEAQFFGFTPQTCMLRIYSAFQDCLCGILLVVENVCVRKLGKKDVKEDEQLKFKARECSQKLQQFLEKRLKSLAGRMEASLVEQCFSIPPNVLLPEDELHRKHPQNIQEVMSLESSLADLQGAYEAELFARQALLAELEEQKEVQEHLNGILRWVGELQAIWLKEGLGSFNDSFPMVMDSVKKLREAVEEICSAQQNVASCGKLGPNCNSIIG